MIVWTELSEYITSWIITSLWVGALLALFLMGLLLTIPEQFARLRHLLASIVLFALPVITTWQTQESSGTGIAPNIAESILASPIASIPESAIPTPTTQSFSLWVAMLWLAVVSFLLVRTARNLFRLTSLRSNSIPIQNAEWNAALDTLKEKLQLRCQVRLLASHRVTSPILFGMFQPVIVVPMSLLTGMPPQHIQPLLAHELSHLARRDFVTSLLSSIVETICFYHPAVWFFSRVIKTERERACDDSGLHCCDSVSEYVRALLWLEENRSFTNDHSLSLAANGTSIASRLERLGRIHGDSSGDTFSLKRILLPLVLVALFFAMDSFAAQSESISTNQGATELLQSVDRSIQRTKLATHVSTGSFLWKEHREDGNENPLFRSVLVVEKDGELHIPYKDGKDLFPDFPNSWILEHELNFLDSSLPVRDSDGDGFTNLEEFEKQTSPSDPASHPLRIHQVAFLGRKTEIFPILYSAQLDANTVQLHSARPNSTRQETEFRKVGEITKNEQFRLEAIGPESVTVVFLPTGNSIELAKKKWSQGKLFFAELATPQKGQENFIVREGEAFRLYAEPEAKYHLRAVEENQCLVELPDGSPLTILRTTIRK